MNEDEAAAVIEARVDAGWPSLFAAGAAPPIARQNDTGFVKPTDRASGMALPFLYVEIEFTPIPAQNGGEIGQITIGAPGENIARKWGLISAHVFVPIGLGDRCARQFGVKFIGLFQGRDFDGVTCRTGSLTGGGTADEDGSYYGRTAIIPFYFDDVA